MPTRPRPRLAVEELEARLALSTYYVAPSGNDGNPGNNTLPWQTLQHAADSVVAGDTVIVEAGNYAGFVVGWDTANPGTPTAPITFDAQPGATVTGRNADTADGIDLEPGDGYWVINGFTVTNDGSITRAGIRVTGSPGVVVENNNVSGMGTWAIFSGFADNLTVTNNVAANSLSQHGIYVSNSCVNPVVTRNTVYGNAGCGIQLNGDISQGGNGLITGALIADNVIHDNGTAGGAGINCDGVQSSTIENNLIYAEHASGIALFRQDGGGGSKNNVVVNNTVLVAADGRWALNINTGSTGNKVFNNILYDANARHGSIEITSDSLSGFRSDYNVVVNAFSKDGGNTLLTLSRWRTLTGQDRHSRIATPAQLFVNVSGNDYHLSPTSPAINAGTSQDAPPTDLDGNPRPYPGRGYDIGCYEYQGNPQRPEAVDAALAPPPERGETADALLVAFLLRHEGQA
jgi:hypothetical protein